MHYYIIYVDFFFIVHIIDTLITHWNKIFIDQKCLCNILAEVCEKKNPFNYKKYIWRDFFYVN
jgi:hypothetical protein